MERTKASIDLAICLRLIQQLRYGEAVNAFETSLDKLIAAKYPPQSVDLAKDLKKLVSVLHESLARSFSSGKPMSGAVDELLACSFCGKSQDEVKKLIAGPSVFICDECVDFCNDIMAEEVDENSGDDRGEELAPETARECVVCGKLRAPEEVVLIPSLKQYFCVTCVEEHFTAGDRDKTK